MKKSLLTFASVCLFGLTAFSQDPDFDKKFRFGLRVNMQPTWFSSAQKSNVPSGAKFGYGFGLNIERRFSEVAGLLTGIGADFEGGKYTFKNDKAANYESMYWLDENNEFVKANANNRSKKTNTGYVLKERSIRTTHITIPVLLKLSTKEYNGLKYSGMFGGELGIRIKAIASDTYLEGRKKNILGGDSIVPVEDLSGLNVNKECSLLPFRLAFNAGLGVEYRLGGSTAAFLNVNYVMFTNLMKKESEYTIYKTEPGADNSTPIKQDLRMRAVKIAIGIMF